MQYSLLKDIVIIFTLSTLGNFIFTRIKIPTIIGYLLTGVICGPYMLGLIHGQESIDLFAEIGIILLLFMIGLEFSLKHLWKIRHIVFFGGMMQMIVTGLLIMFVARVYNLGWNSALFIGIITALSSTAVVLKILQDRSEITSNFGRTVVGILIFQDLIIVPIILFTPFLGSGSTVLHANIFLLVLKAIFILVFVYVGNRWLMPKILHLIAVTKNEELFFMSILLICLSVALMTSEAGLSLAFGAFLGGLMISSSDYSHNAFNHLVPFKDVFTSFFFVSMGMLLDVVFVIDNFALIVFTALLVILIKSIIGNIVAFVLGHTFRGIIMVGLALSQVGEFSFVIARLGLQYSVINTFYYQMFLSVAIITMSLSPFLMQLGKPLCDALLTLSLPDILIKGLFPLRQVPIPIMHNHLVIIGKDSRSLMLSTMARSMNVPYISVVFDPDIVRQLQEKNEMVIYGDALNEPILAKAHIDSAKVVMISIGNTEITKAVIEKIRRVNKEAFIVVRTKYVTDIEKLYKTGADQVIPEEFETAIGIFRVILQKYMVSQQDINEVIEKIRSDHYGSFNANTNTFDHPLLNDIPDIEVAAVQLPEKSVLTGKSLSSVQLRNVYHVSVVAIKRGNNTIQHPRADEIFAKNDIIYIMGRQEDVAKAVMAFAEN